MEEEKYFSVEHGKRYFWEKMVDTIRSYSRPFYSDSFLYEEGYQLVIVSPVARTAVDMHSIKGYRITSVIVAIELWNGTIRLDRYGNVDIMYRR